MVDISHTKEEIIQEIYNIGYMCDYPRFILAIAEINRDMLITYSEITEEEIIKNSTN